MKKFEDGNYKEQIMEVHSRWANVEYWRAIKERAPNYTSAKYLKGIDMYKNEDGKILQDTFDLSDYILADAKVVTVAGDGFGASGYLRFSFATNTQRIKNSLKKLK